MKRLCAIAMALLIAFPIFARTAHWISADDDSRNSVNTWIEFKRNVTLDKVSHEVNAKIAADTKYWLWINDSLAVFEGGLKRGPNRIDTYYDVVNIGPYLKAGENEIRVLTCHFGKSGFSHVSSGQSGLIFDAESINLVSDSTWLSRRLSAYQCATNPEPNFRLAESNIRYDARLTDVDTFKPSIELGVWGDAPWNNLVLRPIPQWRDYGVKYGDIISSESNGKKVKTIKLPYNMQLTPIVNVTDNEGGHVLYIETDHVYGGGQDCVRAEYVTRKGCQQYESLGWMNGDELRVLYDDSVDVVVNALGYRETGYDADFAGRFECSDSEINRFWQKAMRTLYVNMRDNYFDCPDRERAQWWGDVTILMGQSFYQLSPSANALMRKAICELVDWQRGDGSLFSPIPAGNWDQELPAQMLTAIGTYGFWYYYQNTGDKELMQYVYPAVRRYLSLWSLDEQGLTVERQGGWSWGDWGTDVDMRLLLAEWHYLALQSAINMADLSGNQSDIQEYRQQMERIYEAFNRNWDGSAYRHSSYNGATDDRVQALAVVAGLADSTKYDAIFNTIKAQEYASPYMEKYVLEALMKMGQGAYAVERFKRRFKNMIDDTRHTTLFEGWEEGGYGGGSTNHAWSGGMLTVIAENVCGVKPVESAWKTIEICPNPVISQCAIEIPSVQGLVKSAFSDNDTDFSMTFTIPDGANAKVTLPLNNYAKIELNGKKIKQNKLAQRLFSAGTYTINCVK